MTDFEKTLALHMCIYPKMEPVDYIKLAFQIGRASCRERV